MCPELIVDNDAGARAVSSRVQVATVETGAYAIFALAAPGGPGMWAGYGDGTLRYAPVKQFGAAAVRTVPVHATPLCAAIAGDGQALLAGLDDGRVIRVAPGGVPSLVYRTDRWIEHLAADGRGAFAAVCGRRLVVFNEAGEVSHDIDDHPSTGTGLAFSPDGAQIAVSHYDGVSVWDVATGKQARQLYWHGSHTGVAWAPDGRYVVSTTQDKELHGWRMPGGADIKMSGYPTKIRSIGWTPDARYLVASGADTITSWNFEDAGPSGKPPLEFGYVFNGVVTRVAPHPAAGIVAAGYNNGTVLVGSIEHGNAWIARPPGGGAVTALCWTGDGEGVVAGTEGGALSLIRLDAGLSEDAFR